MTRHDSDTLQRIASNTSALANRPQPKEPKSTNLWDYYVEWLRKREFLIDPVLAKLVKQYECRHDVQMGCGDIGCTKCNLRDFDLHEQNKIGRDRWFNEHVERYRRSKSH